MRNSRFAKTSNNGDENDEKIDFEAEYKLMKEKLRLLSAENDFLSKLYTDGIPNLTFMKTVTDETTHTSDHVKIYTDVSERNFKILSNLNSYVNLNKLDALVSSFLNDCKRNDNIIQFADEEAIKTKVEMYFNDLINMTRLHVKTSNGSIALRAEDKIYNNKGEMKTRLRPDLWGILKDDFRLFIVSEIKVKGIIEAPKRLPKGKIPKIVHIVENNEVIGQIYDYLMMLKNFYGQKYVIGIITTLQEWKICWLPDTDIYACNDNTNYISRFSENEDTNFLNSLPERSICSTSIIQHDDPNLTKTILSALIKGYESPCYPVKMFSTERTYVRLTENNWRWIQYDKNDLEKLNRNITLDVWKNETVGFTVLKYFNGKKYSKVRLALSDDGNYVVLKEFSNEINQIDIQYELDCWHAANNICSVYLDTVVMKRTIVMPLVFNIHEKFGKLYIPMNLKYWSVQPSAKSDVLPEYLENINLQLKEYDNYPSLKEICEIAIDKCARANCIHADLTYRHIGLYPVIENKILLHLEPVLIDFDRIEISDSYDFAYLKMKESIDDIFYTYGEKIEYKFD